MAPPSFPRASAVQLLSIHRSTHPAAAIPPVIALARPVPVCLCCVSTPLPSPPAGDQISPVPPPVLIIELHKARVPKLSGFATHPPSPVTSALGLFAPPLAYVVGHQSKNWFTVPCYDCGNLELGFALNETKFNFGLDLFQCMSIDIKDEAKSDFGLQFAATDSGVGHEKAKVKIIFDFDVINPPLLLNVENEMAKRLVFIAWNIGYGDVCNLNSCNFGIGDSQPTQVESFVFKNGDLSVATQIGSFVLKDEALYVANGEVPCLSVGTIPSCDSFLVVVDPVSKLEWLTSWCGCNIDVTYDSVQNWCVFLGWIWYRDGFDIMCRGEVPEALD